MRTILSIIFFGALFLTRAEQFKVFEKEGLFGLRNEEGEVAVPAIYDGVGWSNGGTDVIGGVIGIRKDKKWGLISVKNKPLTQVSYHSLEPIEGVNFKASVKGKFSNQLFYGILDNFGRVQLSFNYFSLEQLEDKYLVSRYDSRRVKQGVITSEEEVLIPLKYRSIAKKDNFYFGKTWQGTLELYAVRGQRLEINIDSIQHTSRGFICYREGFVGFYETSGNKLEDFIHKKIEVDQGTILTYPYPVWDVLKNGDKKKSIRADSISVMEGDLWVAFNNGAHHFTLVDSVFRNRNYKIRAINEDHLIVKNEVTNRWAVVGRGGQEIISGYDSIAANGEIYWAQSEEGWQLLGRYGKKKSKLKARVFKQGVSHQSIVKVNRYWGLIDRYGREITPFKYDEISTSDIGYKVKYLNRWGTMSDRGEWRLSPEYDEVLTFKGFDMGRKGMAFTYLSNGKTWKSTIQPIELLEEGHLLIANNAKLKGVLNKDLELAVPTQFTNVESIENYFVAYTDSTCSLYDWQGKLLIGPDKGLQDIAGLGEDYLLVKKDNRWGFVDMQGRMRVSNRYEDAKVFSEGLAPIKLRGKWGFINKSEKLVVQPFYDSVTSFSNGLSVVEANNRKGLISKEGREILSVTWRELRRTRYGNFIARDDSGQYGLVSETGHFLLRPDFEFLEDRGSMVIVTKNDKKGILEYSGRELFQITYGDLKISGDFILLKQ